MRIGALALAATIAIAAPAAFADKKAEAYVEQQCNAVLKVLSDTSLTPEARRKKFSEYMHTFANFPSIARRVLGAEGRSLSEADFDKYYKVFEQYAVMTYEVQLDQFRGKSIKVTGSRDDDPKRSTVASLIQSTQTGKDVKVYWDVLQSQDGQTYRVRDIGIDVTGSVFWLAQEQQSQFEAILNRNNGDINKLIGRIDQLMADMEAKKPTATSVSARTKGG